MAATIDQLRVKVERIEQELAEVRQELHELSRAESLSPQQWWEARTARVRAENEQLRPLIDKVFEEMGIVGEPIGAERVQELVAACGVKPEENLFSRGIIEMRQE
jgi:acetylornithine deacetylase/succinyl-diaminopimelate desuccinylase-like protein